MKPGIDVPHTEADISSLPEQHEEKGGKAILITWELEPSLPTSHPPHPVLWCPALHFSQQEFTKQDPTQVLTQSCEVGASLVLIALTLHIQTCCPSAESKAQPSEVVSHPGNSTAGAPTSFGHVSLFP